MSEAAQNPTQHPWAFRIRAGWPSITPVLFNTLVRLREAKEAGSPYVDLSGLHPHTTNGLVERDWIVEHNLGERVYTITGRGLKAIKVYEQPVRRRDGLCPRCGERPRIVRRSGQRGPYCQSCKRKIDRRMYALKGRQYRPESLCPVCNERPRHVSASGHENPYCQECRRAKDLVVRRKRHARRLERIAAGEFIACKNCPDKPIYHSQKTTWDYCHDCYRKQQNEYQRRYIRQKAVAKAFPRA